MFGVPNTELNAMDVKTQRIKIARKKLRKTQADFASALGVGRNKYINWEKDCIPDRYIDSLIRMFHINPVYIQTGEDELFLTVSGNELKTSSITDETKDVAMNAMAKTIRELQSYIATLETENEKFRRQLI